MAKATVEERPLRARRSCLAVPGSSPKMLAKAASLRADEVFLDLEDAVAPEAKERARDTVVAALRETDWADKTMVVRINGIDTKWAADDIQTVVRGAGEHLDCLMIPKVEHAHQVLFVDHLLRMLEHNLKLEKRIGLEAQIESAVGLQHLHEIANSSDRLEALIFGPADMSASLGLPMLSAGLPMPGYPGDPFHSVLVAILVAARAAGLQAIDGPYPVINDTEGFRNAALRARALGYDGKWALHPSQIEILNEVFRPTREEFDKAVGILETYEQVMKVEQRGATMLGDEMIDEASRKIALQVIERGRRAGMHTVLSRTKESTGLERSDQ